MPLDRTDLPLRSLFFGDRAKSQSVPTLTATLGITIHMFNKKKFYRRIDQSISASSKVMIRKCFDIKAVATGAVPRGKTMPEQPKVTRTLKTIRVGRDYKQAIAGLDFADPRHANRRIDTDALILTPGDRSTALLLKNCFSERLVVRQGFAGTAVEDYEDEMKTYISIRRISPEFVQVIAKRKGKTYTWERKGKTWSQRHGKERDRREVAEKEDCRTLDQWVSEREEISTDEKPKPNKSPDESKSKHRVLLSARKYIRRGWQVVPILPKKKVPRRKDWQKERIKKSKIPRYFRKGDNIGILWGKPSHWAVDVDLDCDEAVALAPSFLPETDMVFGRKTRPDSHYVYECNGMEPMKFNDPEPSAPDDACLLELRSNGQQTLVPPSTHPSGERIRWKTRGEPGSVSPDELRIALGRLGAAALLARRWKLGIRNEIALSLSGALLRAGWRKEQVIKFIEAIVLAAGDNELKKRVAAVEPTWEKLAKGREVTGIPKLVELLGEKTVSNICNWLGIGMEKSIASVDQLEEVGIFHTYEEFEDAPPISFAIESFLQNGCATMIAGLSGHGKTLAMLSIAKSLLNSHKHKKLWHQFRVLETASRVLYLTPESGITPFKDRLKRFHIYHYLEEGRLLVHTLSKGLSPALSDPRILEAAKDAYVFLDPIIRFEEGNENEAVDNQRGLATDIFALLGAGARAVIAAHHAPKNFAKETVMTLENMLRGTGDIGAMVATAWGTKQLDAEKNIIHIENLKARDFEPGGPFQIIGRPYINEEGDFRIHKKPGECGSLAEEQKSHNQGGAPVKARKAKVANKELLCGFLKDDPKATSPELIERFKQEGIKLSESAIRKYRMEIRKDAKKGA